MSKKLLFLVNSNKLYLTRDPSSLNLALGSVLGYYEKEVIWLADRREFCNVLNKYKKDLKLDARKMDTLLPKSETVTFSLSNKTRNRLISYENLLKIFKEKIRAITIENLPKVR